MKRFRYRQIFLFLVVLVLPMAAIITLDHRNAEAERELAAKRQDERKNGAAADIGQDVLALLRDIKLQVIGGASAGAVPQAAVYSDRAIAFVGRQEGSRLVWPWDAALKSSPPVPDQFDFIQRTDDEAEHAEPDSNPIAAPAAGFLQKMDEAEHAELRARNYAEAADLYREAARVARSDTQRASAQLGLANTLTRSGRVAEATRVYLELLNRPSTVVDDHGVPFALYAASGLSGSRAADAEVLKRLERDLEPNVPLTPGSAYQMHSILETLKGSPEAATMMEPLADRISDLEEALEVQGKFGNLQVTADAWQLYRGSTLWWIGKAPTGASSPPLIVAVRVEDIRKSVEAERVSRGEPSFQFVTNGEGGLPLSHNLPGVRVELGPEADAGAAASSSAQRIFRGVSLILVVILTFLGAFFLWRDMRRESRMAELRSQFVSSVSHELKTPLTAIRMFAESMQMDDEAGSSDPKERQEYLDTIVSETERLTRLLNNVLDFSRIERGQKNYHLQPEELPRVLSDAARTMRFPLAEQGFKLQVDLSEDLPRIKVDRDAIEQAVLNLLSNAMKYSGKNRDIALRLCRRNGDALIQVSDHGIGIPAEEQRRIFEKFYRVPSKENRAISGTGLGLSLVAHIAEAHGGGVEVESRSGEGSTFSIRIPLPPGDSAPQSSGMRAAAL